MYKHKLHNSYVQKTAQKMLVKLTPCFYVSFCKKVGREIRERVEEGEKEESSENGLRERIRERREIVRWN
jgi:hypothetical protein